MDAGLHSNAAYPSQFQEESMHAGDASLWVFTPSGIFMRRWKLDKCVRIVQFGWVYAHDAGTDLSGPRAGHERLMVVWEDATVHLYSVQFSTFQVISLGKVGPHIDKAYVYEDGCVLVNQEGHFYIVDGLRVDMNSTRSTKSSDPDRGALAPLSLALPQVQHTMTSLHSAQLPADIQCWTVLKSLNSVGSADVLLSDSSSIYLLDGASCRPLHRLGAACSAIQVSPNGKLIATFSTSGKLQVFSSDFQKQVLEFPAKSRQFPTQVRWCGDDAVALNWDEILLLVGPFGDWVKYVLEHPVLLFSECDGLRLVSATRHEIIQKVPDSLENVFRIGSTHPAALLYDARDMFERRDSHADDIIRSIHDRLREAVDVLMDAALQEFSIPIQKALLRSATLGKSFCGPYASDEFLKTSKTLRVMNSLREAAVGLPLTHEEYRRLTTDGILIRLIAQNKYLMAIKMCEHLKLNTRSVCLAWMARKISLSNEPDDVIYDQVHPKLSPTGVQAIEAARIAYNAGRPTLSIKFLATAHMTFDQIPLLLDMQENEVALARAVRSGDANMVYVVLFNLKHRLPLGDFFRILNDHPVAQNHFERFCKLRDPNMLRDLYYQADRKWDSASVLLESAWSSRDMTQRVKEWKTALRIVADQKDCQFIAKSLDDQIRLFQIQQQLETERLQTFCGLSLSETIHKLIFIKMGQRAEKMKAEFHVPEKRFWYIKIRALAAIKDWDALDKFSRSKKPPVGFKPFVMECIANGNQLEAKKYILKCDNAIRPLLFTQIGAYREAALAAYSLKDTAILLGIRNQIQNSVLKEEVDQLLLQLGLRED